MDEKWIQGIDLLTELQEVMEVSQFEKCLRSVKKEVLKLRKSGFYIIFPTI